MWGWEGKVLRDLVLALNPTSERGEIAEGRGSRGALGELGPAESFLCGWQQADGIRRHVYFSRHQRHVPNGRRRRGLPFCGQPLQGQPVQIRQTRPLATRTRGKEEVTRTCGGRVKRPSGFGEDAFVVVFVDGDDVVGAEFFPGVDAGALAHFAAAVGAGSQTEQATLRPRLPNRAWGSPSWKEKKREVPPLRNPTISQEVRWEEKVGLLRSG